MGARGAPKGNKNAAKDNRIVGDMLRKVAAQNKAKLREACETLLEKAAQGDIPAFVAFADRLDGKPAQQVIGPGEDGSHKMVVEIVRFADTTAK